MNFGEQPHRMLTPEQSLIMMEWIRVMYGNRPDIDMPGYVSSRDSNELAVFIGGLARGLAEGGVTPFVAADVSKVDIQIADPAA
ncbi:hypothetical protein JNM87_01720 [Candidatus Saccharibacteria bacterium]|nr:hypothetical protein [Candidatus Saccharibacteria bacterium]